ncbi:hypothetical protein SXCC_00903 [Gluconacetobacter sp. SXCC-1]|nr:hypothetical protein SXCC_00903 [Gluconacetobacter sp. SXCC-1]
MWGTMVQAIGAAGPVRMAWNRANVWRPSRLRRMAGLAGGVYMKKAPGPVWSRRPCLCPCSRRGDADQTE